MAILAGVITGGATFGVTTHASPPIEVTLREGQILGIPGTDLTVEVLRVVDLTGRGCVGGPVGCRDTVEVTVTRGVENRHLTLYVAQTPSQRRQADTATAFGYEIALIALEDKLVRLEIRRSP